MLRSLRRRTLLIVQLIVVSMMLASCTGAQDSAGPTATPISGNTSGGAVATSTTGTTATAPTAAPQGGTNVGPAPTMKNPDTIVEATSADAQTLDPAWLYDTNSWAIAFQVYESLIMLNREHTDQFVPMLATKWDISPDGKTYTFNI